MQRLLCVTVPFIGAAAITTTALAVSHHRQQQKLNPFAYPRDNRLWTILDPDAIPVEKLKEAIVADQYLYCFLPTKYRTKELSKYYIKAHPDMLSSVPPKVRTKSMLEYCARNPYPKPCHFTDKLDSSLINFSNVALDGKTFNELFPDKHFTSSDLSLKSGLNIRTGFRSYHPPGWSFSPGFEHSLMIPDGFDFSEATASDKRQIRIPPDAKVFIGDRGRIISDKVILC